MVIKEFFFKTATSKIILINLIVYLFVIIFSFFSDIQTALSYFALTPSSIIQGQRLWTLFTSMFVHIQFWHLAANMIVLYFIGTFVEKLIGKKRFVIFYILAGLFAGIFWVILSGFFSIHPILINVFGNPNISGVGASGALFGLIGILAVLTPKAKVFFLAGPMIALIIPFILSSIFDTYNLISEPLFAGILSLVSLFATLYFIFAIFAIMSFDRNLRRFALPLELEMWVLPIVAIVPFVLISIFFELPIGNMAHLGGLIAGLGYSYYLKKKYPRKSKMIKRMFQ